MQECKGHHPPIRDFSGDNQLKPVTAVPQPQLITKHFLTVQEAADIMSCSLADIAVMILTGQIPAVDNPRAGTRIPSAAIYMSMLEREGLVRPAFETLWHKQTLSWQQVHDQFTERTGLDSQAWLAARHEQKVIDDEHWMLNDMQAHWLQNHSQQDQFTVQRPYRGTLRNRDEVQNALSQLVAGSPAWMTPVQRQSLIQEYTQTLDEQSAVIPDSREI